MNESRRILILFAHPAVRRSRVNRRLIEAVRWLDGLTVRDLYERYPEFDIDAAEEQQQLAAHDVVVFQHPFYWYSTPAILKEWQDLVLEHGWAYGTDGDALEGKLLMNAITTGGVEETYCRQGSNHYTMRELLAPVEQTARLCGMEFLPPFVVHGTHSLTEREIDGHASDYRRTLEALRDGHLDVERVSGLVRLNSDLDAVIGD
jgi:glutathione-regulated potassium-efflux system ancillary protein KefG